MIITSLKGGLGNQLFQYAFGRRMALQNNSPLQLDMSFFNTAKGNRPFSERPYELSVFKIHAEPASDGTIRRIKNSINNPIIRRLREQFPSLFHYKIFKEKSFEFDPEVNSLKGNLYLEGYWQSEKYFGSMEKDLRKEFVFLPQASEANLKALDEIKNSNAVSLHIRRGDLVASKEAAEFHGVLPMEYYEKALAMMMERVPGLRVFIFSDDPEWARSNSLFAGSTIIDWNQGSRSYEDLRLMSNCKHHILANSSFSWWGVWLNPSAEKIVIAPKQWFRNPKINTSDLIPPSWIRI